MDKNLIDAWANMLAYGESDPAYQELRSSFHENYVEAIRLYENTMNHIHLLKKYGIMFMISFLIRTLSL